MTREEYSEAYGTGFNLTVRLLISRGLSAEQARETAQAAWAKGWERREQLRKPWMVTTWVNTIALNGYRSFLRGEPRFEELHESPHPTRQNLAAIDVKALLENCKKNDRVVLDEHYLQGLKVQEIAERHGWTETAVRIRLLRARRNLRQKVDKKVIPPCYFKEAALRKQDAEPVAKTKRRATGEGKRCSTRKSSAKARVTSKATATA